MARLASVLLSSAWLASAPFQCTGDKDPSQAVEETPGQAVYKLAERMKAEGRRDAWITTLRYLVETYPSSRFAVMARADLAAAGVERR